ncbi:MAG: hypothetical protein NWQ23_06515 [Yoonia sp.]|uniref:hypothetical protein n=1 Tax=Yoonia sp. TaxID=2212373 RepID=UPI00273FCF38|nr:hypothetical protein [Yoonia sp.]MDP5085057.1 hypothetical protein [Yoonia sp.]
MRYLMILTMMILGSAAAAQNVLYLSSDGALFNYETNRHGAVMTSVEPPDANMVVASDTTPAVAPGQVIYLGRACDAFSKQLGEGSWRATEGGFFVEFGDLRVAFPGQELGLVRGDRCRGTS